tara:strand:+ start:2003 stop:2188 length:186 start_codon:yes stop_codon:yes gene_type:complete
MHEKFLTHGARHFATTLAMAAEQEFGKDWKPLSVNQEVALTASVEQLLRQITKWQKALSET